MEKLIAALSPIAAIVAGAFALYFWVDSRYVNRQPDFVNLQQRFELKVKSDYLQQTNARIWTLEDRLTTNRADQTAKEELRQLNDVKRTVEAELASLRTSPKP